MMLYCFIHLPKQQQDDTVNFSFLVPSSPNRGTGLLCLAGDSPASPEPPAFPVLPDLSPKKVSAMHNVYVSPLRAIKVCYPAMDPTL